MSDPVPPAPRSAELIPTLVSNALDDIESGHLALEDALLVLALCVWRAAQGHYERHDAMDHHNVRILALDGELQP